MKPTDVYPENLVEILDTYGELEIKNPLDGKVAPVSDAVEECVDEEGTYHLLDMLVGMTVDDAGIVLRDLVPED